MKRVVPCIILFWMALMQPAISDGDVPFELDVLPVLQKRCMVCHGEKKQESGLRVDSRAALLKGGDFGVAIVPGDVAKSHLIEVVTSTDADVMMPPKGERLSNSEVAALKQWITEGAIWPGQMDAATQERITSTHWAFQPRLDRWIHPVPAH
jgi:Planctomycete cytochrome C